ncbi:N-alpha-acetyltransferase 80-like isoform X2 [Antedon mediterranea]|uniref:N-alpha-acetyltransferase 80-like isoform X2 n=1 Tax=Antedon mediterranea TaxID=105859 RepID=UPI003AF4BA7C
MIKKCSYLKIPNNRRYDLVALHDTGLGLSLVESCVELLNSEWPRSHSARLHSLKKSNDSLPVCFALVEVDVCTQSSSTVGHSRIIKVMGQPDSVLIESVVVPKCRRGEGIGRILMELTETCCKKLGFTTIYLSTKDKERFYSHLGYSVCNPVNTIGAQMQSNLGTDDNGVSYQDSLISNSCENTEVQKPLLTSVPTLSPSAPIPSHSAPISTPSAPTPPPSAPTPPVPPPPPPPTINQSPITFQVWMKKDV